MKKLFLLLSIFSIAWQMHGMDNFFSYFRKKGEAVTNVPTDTALKIFQNEKSKATAFNLLVDGPTNSYANLDKPKKTDFQAVIAIWQTLYGSTDLLPSALNVRLKALQQYENSQQYKNISLLSNHIKQQNNNSSPITNEIDGCSKLYEPLYQQLYQFSQNNTTTVSESELRLITTLTNAFGDSFLDTLKQIEPLAFADEE